MRERIISELRKIVGQDIEPSVEFQEYVVNGHYSTTIAFSIARGKKENPMNVARNIAEKCKNNPFFEKIDVVEPGFINFWVSGSEFYDEIKKITKDKNKYGSNETWKKKSARVEYVSANPTGPVHIGNVRGGPYGEVICKTLEKSGCKVLREYFHNDAGTQVEKLGLTVWYWYKKECGEDVEFPEGGYLGEYLSEVASMAIKKFGNKLKDDDIGKLTDFTLDIIYKENMNVLKQLGISFDLVRKESELLNSRKTEKLIEYLKSKKILKSRDGAWWFAPKDEFLEDRESVVVRSNGKPTYFASDIAYHKEKFESGYDFVIDVFGSNHHGHVPKLQALTNIFKFNPSNFLVLLYQFVRVKKGDEIVKMSKRAGTYITAKEVLDEVGADAMSFSLLSSAPSTHIDFDLELAKEQSMKNPVYYVQYAYVRSVNILDKVKIKKNADLSCLSTEEDSALMRKLVQFPEIVEQTAKDFEVHRLTRYAFELARAFHGFYEKERVVGENKSVSCARAVLVKASSIVLKNVFDLIGISAPQKM